MKKLLFLIVSLVSLACQAQDGGNILLPENQKKNNFFDNFTLGGDVGFTFGKYQWGLSLAPRIGYKITNDLEAAFSVNYTYQDTDYAKYNILGLGPSLTYYIGRYLYVNGSFQHYFVSTKSKSTRITYKTKESALSLGGGYMQYLGGRSYLRLGLTYNVLYDKNKSIFSSGLFPEVGIVIGL